MFFRSDQTDTEMNPLDSLESVLSNYNWVFDRMNDEELYVKLAGKSNEYNVYFNWDDHLNILQICCQFDLTITDASRTFALDTIAKMNENLYLGHFFMPENSNRPSYRYSALIKNLSDDQARGMINDLVDLSLAQCERCASAFAMLQEPEEEIKTDHSKIDLALMETVGES